jgi:hypothetical protein
MEVRCPECRKIVLVPTVDAANRDEPTGKRDSLPDGDAPDPAAASSKEIGAPTISPAVPEFFDAELYRPTDSARGAPILSPLYASLLTIGAVVILALAFAAGLLVGRFVL